MPRLKVPHIKQLNATSCGAACLAMIFAYWKKPKSVAEIWQSCKSPRPNSPGEYIPSSNLLKYADSHGFTVLGSPSAANVSQNIVPVVKFLSMGFPIIVCQRVSLNSPWGHFRIVTGYTKSHLYVNDPMKDEEFNKISTGTFTKLWEKTNDSEVTGGQYFALIPNDKFKITHHNNNTQIDPI